MTTRVFLQVEEYKDILDAIDVVKSRLVVAKQLLAELHQIRSKENHEMRLAKERLKHMEDVATKMHDEVFS